MIETLASSSSGYDKSLGDYKIPRYRKKEVGEVIEKLQADPKLEAAARLVMFNATVSRGGEPLMKASETSARYDDYLKSLPRQDREGLQAVSSTPAEKRAIARKSQEKAALKVAAALARQNGVTLQQMQARNEQEFEANIFRSSEYRAIMDAVDVMSEFEDAVPHPSSFDYETAAVQYELPLLTPEQGFDALRASQAVPVGALAMGTTISYPPAA